MPYGYRIGPTQLERAAHDDQKRFARRIENPDWKLRMLGGAGKDGGFPRKPKILEKRGARDEIEMEMNVDDAACGIVVADIARKRRVVAACNGRTELIAADGQ